MATFSEKPPRWWDRDVDCAGRPIRVDVRTAAHEIWEQARRRARTLLGDDNDTAVIIEESVESRDILTKCELFAAVFESDQKKAQRIEFIGRVPESQSLTHSGTVAGTNATH